MRNQSMLTTTVILICSLAAAFSDQKMTVAGLIKSFDSKNAQIVVGDKVYDVPRNIILLSKIKPGQKIEFEIFEEDFKKLKSTAVKK